MVRAPVEHLIPSLGIIRLIVSIGQANHRIKAIICASQCVKALAYDTRRLGLGAVDSDHIMIMNLNTDYAHSKFQKQGDIAVTADGPVMVTLKSRMLWIILPRSDVVIDVKICATVNGAGDWRAKLSVNNTKLLNECSSSSCHVLIRVTLYGLCFSTRRIGPSQPLCKSWNGNAGKHFKYSEVQQSSFAEPFLQAITQLGLTMLPMLFED